MTLRILPYEKPEKPPAAAVPAVPRTLALREARAGGRVRLLSVHLEAVQRKRLHDSGVVEGDAFLVLYNDHKGTVALELRGKTIILGRRETYRMRVREL